MSLPIGARSHQEYQQVTGSADGPSPLILLAEDNENEAFFLKRALTKMAFPGTLHHVEAGDIAIEWLKFVSKNQVPSLVILDLKMPRTDGLEVLQWIRSQPDFQTLPTVIFSSSDLPADRLRAEQISASGYYIKPLSSPGLWLHNSCDPGTMASQPTPAETPNQLNGSLSLSLLQYLTCEAPTS
ncbi:MAG: response regulator [Verrucomicrobiales bacterium]|nr:response regulator [Verrucomicrobiales bacterium]